MKQELRGFTPRGTAKRSADDINDRKNYPMVKLCDTMNGLDGVIICGSTIHDFVSKEGESRSQATHITTEVEPKRKASAIKGTLESPKILH